MAWNPEPKVADLRDIAKKWQKHHVITLAWDDDELHLVTFGSDKAKCAEAANSHGLNSDGTPCVM